MDTNSSVQDASNQTDSMISFGEEDDDGEDNDDDEDVLRINEECEEPDKDRKEDDIQLEDKPAALPETKVYFENPDFSGLQLLLNGIERVEHSRISPKICEEVAKKETEAADVAQMLPQPNKETEDGDTEKPVPNSLEILCALADQRFKEEKEVAESDEESLSSDSELKKQSRKEGKKVNNETMMV